MYYHSSTQQLLFLLIKIPFLLFCKISTYLEAIEKTYVAELTLGITTSSLDTEGEIIEVKEVNLPNREKLDEIFKSFLGEIDQIPPMHSAIKVDGEPLYKKARRGEVIERKPRRVTIHDIKILGLVKPPFIKR